MGRKTKSLAEAKTDVIKAVIADKIAGQTIEVISAKYGISRKTVSTYWKHFREMPTATSTQPMASRTVPDNSALADYKAGFKERAIKAVNNGLECDLDPYKQGSLGATILRGIGELGDAAAPTQISLLIASIPASLVERYRGHVIDVTPIPPGEQLSLVSSNEVAEGDSE